MVQNEQSCSSNDKDIPIDTTANQTSSPDSTNETHGYPPLPTVLLVMCGLYIAMFLVSLDRIIISTAVPKITDEFHSTEDIGWYGSAYVLAACSTQLLFGRFYSSYNNKIIFIISIILFETGSALCGAAPTSKAFIIGRAIAGIGSAGVMSGVVVMMIPITPLDKRPIYQGLIGAIFGVSSVIGPIVGGAFTNNIHLTWRWCFYINLPIGAVSLVVVIFVLRIPPTTKQNTTIVEKLKRLDPIGNILFTTAVICLLLALEWGGSKYPWRSSRIVALFILSGVLLILWIVSQATNKINAIVPSRIFLQRSIMAGCTFAMCIGGVMLTFVYYMPVWFQAVDGIDALQSGIHTLPFVLAIVAASIVAGGFVSQVGYYSPFVIASACIMSIGAGLLTTWKVNSSKSQWIGYQFLVGFGIGLGMQQNSLAAQVVLKQEDVSIGVALGIVSQNLGAAIFLCVAQNIFISELVKQLSAVLPFATAERLADVGATNLRQFVPANLLPDVLIGYNKAVVTTFYVGVGIASFSIVPALAFEWRSVRERKDKELKAQNCERTTKDQ